MNSAVQKVFLNRVQYALGWAILIGLTASLNLTPPHQDRQVAEQNEVREVVTTQAAVIPRTLPQHDRVVKWFAAFDQIRERAKMSPMEKANAIKLWATSFATTSESDKKDARQLLNSMVQRYRCASDEIAKLSEIPETKQLQAGYAKFFKQAKSDFEEYVVALDRQSTKAALAKMADGRQALAAIDVQNKNLDRKIRQQFGIPEID